MTDQPAPESILRDIARIQRMDRGSVSVFRQGPDGPYFNHQSYENGRNVSRYVPREQVPELKEAIAGYHRFEQLTAQYARIMIDQTRAERQAGSKKKPPHRRSSSPKTKKSGN